MKSSTVSNLAWAGNVKLNFNQESVEFSAQNKTKQKTKYMNELK